MEQPTLDTALADCWTRFAEGARDRRSAFHTPSVASLVDGVPRQRVMVLRGVDAGAALLRFNTDVRSAKVPALARASAISVLAYDAAARIQVLASGTARVIGDGAEADEGWASSVPSSRRAYLSDPAPGTPADAPVSGLPVELTTRVPTLAESEAGRANFAVILVTVDRLEWLELTASGNRRAAFARGGVGWSGSWVIP